MRVALLLLLVLAACAPTAPSADGRLDLALRQALAGRERAGSDAPLAVLVRLDASPDAARRAALAESGVTVRTEAGDVVTAEGPPSAIRRVAALPFVRSISLSQRRGSSEGSTP